MEQDLFSWLNSQNKTWDEGLLVAPLSREMPGDVSILKEDTPSQDSYSKNRAADSKSDSYIQLQSVISENQVTDSESNQQDLTANFHSEAAEDFHDTQSGASHELWTSYPQANAQSSQQDLTADFQKEPAEDFHDTQSGVSYDDSPANIPQDSPSDEIPDDDDLTQSLPPEIVSYGDDDDEIPQDHDWQERATGFTLSLDEPPPELWTHINDDDPDPEYEATDSLQGAAYVQIHGRNFTERLHHTLKHRKERAEERAQAENDNNRSKPFMQIAIILCSTLIMIMGFAWLSLWFIGRETPEGMKSRALSLTEQGQYDEASSIYQRAYRRYPNDPEILARLSSSAEKAGHPQTAKAARDEYNRNFPETVSKEPERGKEPEQKKEIIIPIKNKKPSTFHDYLTEGNHFYNIGMYNRAALNFFRAIQINSRDVRAYIGLANAYRKKGMYFDSGRILDEARRLFGGSPALDMSLYFLREDINGR